MPSLLDCLPGGVSGPSRLSESAHCRRTGLPSALSFHPVSHLQGEDAFPAHCAPNSDSKEEKRRLGKAGTVHGPLESEGLLMKPVRKD